MTFDVFRCPACRGPLQHLAVDALTCVTCPRWFLIINGVPRFMMSDAYTGAFSYEWTKHVTTQLDSATGRTDSRDRFAQTLGLSRHALDGQLVLDVGCGTGRFAEIALKYGATVVGVDLSNAVNAAFKNLGTHPHFQVAQADIFQLPFALETFDLIYSLGVLHHTPNAEDAFQHLVPYLKPGGSIVITVYTDRNPYYVRATNFWRRWTPRLPRWFLYALCHLAVPLYYVYKIPIIRQMGLGLWPINLDPRWRWRVLDTFDCYAPQYQSYHSFPEVWAWFQAAGLEQIQISEPAVTVRGQAPPGS